MGEKAKALVESRAFQAFITAVIIVNSIVIGVQTAPLPPWLAEALNIFDGVCLAIYVVEALLKIYAYRLRYFRDGWNIFDFTIVVLCLLPVLALPFPVQVMRIIRIVRVFRVFMLVSAFRPLRVIVQAIGKAIPGVAWTSVLLIIVYYVFAVIGTNMFAREFPDWFGNLGDSFYTLFQVMTLESWSMGISRPVMEVFPWAWAYFVPFVIISAFIFLNVVVGIVVGVIEEAQVATTAEDLESEREAGHITEKEQLKLEIAKLKEQIERLESLAD